MILVYFWDIFGFLREKKFKDGGQPLAKVKTKHPIWPRLPLARLLGRVGAGNMGVFGSKAGPSCCICEMQAFYM